MLKWTKLTSKLELIALDSSERAIIQENELVNAEMVAKESFQTEMAIR